jgi:hypothetical protein
VRTGRARHRARASGLPADPAALAERVYVPGRRGSFHAELITATRAAGRIP